MFPDFFLNIYQLKQPYRWKRYLQRGLHDSKRFHFKPLSDQYVEDIVVFIALGVFNYLKQRTTNENINF